MNLKNIIMDFDVLGENIFKSQLDKLDKYKNTHPNIYKLWSNYFKLLAERLEKTLSNFDNVLCNIDTFSQADLTDENIYFIYMYAKCNNL